MHQGTKSQSNPVPNRIDWEYLQRRFCTAEQDRSAMQSFTLFLANWIRWIKRIRWIRSCMKCSGDLTIIIDSRLPEQEAERPHLNHKQEAERASRKCKPLVLTPRDTFSSMAPCRKSSVSTLNRATDWEPSVQTHKFILVRIITRSFSCAKHAIK